MKKSSWDWPVANIDEHEGIVDQAILRRLLTDGLTREVHDSLVEELFIARPEAVDRFYNGDISKYENKIYCYTSKELTLEKKLNGYMFILPKDTNELRKWGNLFHNCVASYDNGIMEKYSSVLAMREDGKYVACIEVRQGRILQALGYCNQRLANKYRKIIKEWAEECKILYRYN